MSNDAANDRLWGGRFSAQPAEVAQAFSASVDVDARLAPQDMRASLVHAEMLARQGIIPAADLEAIRRGFAALKAKLEAGEMPWDDALEDVHLNLEHQLTEAVGDAGRRLHTARSRNDQVATDMRLWCREAAEACASAVVALCEAVLQRVTQDGAALMPAYTHLQRAQPIRLGHHLLAWVAMWLRDVERLLAARAHMNECPLGSGALATTTFPIDREATAEALAFRAPMWNSLDAVSSRDFLLELLSALSILGLHLSRVAEELVLWTTQEFAFATMDDAFATGSSMMPQKKNPDMAELIRGKAGVAPAAFLQLAMMLKGLPLTYNRDLQEDKEPVFRSVDTLLGCLNVMRGMVETLRFNPEAMRAALKDGFLEATDVADYLVAKGVPFREAHAHSGRLVALAQSRGVTLGELSLEDYQQAHAAFEADIFTAIDMERLVESRQVLGGPAQARVDEGVREAQRRLAALQAKLAEAVAS